MMTGEAVKTARITNLTNSENLLLSAGAEINTGENKNRNSRGSYQADSRRTVSNLFDLLWPDSSSSALPIYRRLGTGPVHLSLTDLAIDMRTVFVPFYHPSTSLRFSPTTPLNQHSSFSCLMNPRAALATAANMRGNHGQCRPFPTYLLSLSRHPSQPPVRCWDTQHHYSVPDREVPSLPLLPDGGASGIVCFVSVPTFELGHERI